MSNHKSKKIKDTINIIISGIAYSIAIIFVIWVIIHLLILADGKLSLKFILTPPKSGMTEGGILTPLLGTIYLAIWVLIFSVPVGILAGTYLAEFAPNNILVSIIRGSIRALASIPAVVYGIAGFALFVSAMKLGLSLISSALTLSLMSLPVIITTTEEGLNLVPRYAKEGALALGASKWHTWKDISLRYSIGSILSGIFLAISRAVGETAPILFTGAVFYQATVTPNPFSTFMALPYHIFILSTQHSKFEEVKSIAAAASLVLLLLVILMRIIAFVFKRRVQKWM